MAPSCRNDNKLWEEGGSLLVSEFILTPSDIFLSED